MSADPCGQLNSEPFVEELLALRVWRPCDEIDTVPGLTADTPKFTSLMVRGNEAITFFVHWKN